MNKISRDFLSDFKREPSTIWCTCIIKSPDFNEIKEIKELSDFSQFSKESLLPFGVCNEQISSDFLLGFKGASFGEKL